MSRCIERVRAYATTDILNELAGLLDRYGKIGIFGQMQSYSVAMNFQFELASLGKHVSSFLLLGPQIRFNLNKVRGLLPGKIVEVIDMRAYGMLDGKAVINFVKQKLGD